jgi:endonuclease YncB( thermonuclease family)
MRNKWSLVAVLCLLLALGWLQGSSHISLEAYAVEEIKKPTLEQNVLSHLDRVAVKRLAPTDIDPEVSNQREITGVKALQELFGTQTPRQEFRARMMYYGSKVFTTDVALTWYNASLDANEERWRLYYQKNPVIEAANPKDSIVIARYGQDNILAIVAPYGTAYETELFKIFGIKDGITARGIHVPFTQPKRPKLLTAIHEQLQQTGKMPVEISLWKDVQSGEVTVEGKVESVKDGDTFNVAGVFDIRLMGIDAPEKKQTCRRNGVVWNCGEEARQFLASLILGKQVHCTNKKKEKYGRFMSMCEVGGKNLNSAMIEKGLAVIYYSEEFADKEREARLDHVGLWGSEFVNPEDFRRKRY